MNELTQMSDKDRLHFDTESENCIKSCSEALNTLKQTGKLSIFVFLLNLKNQDIIKHLPGFKTHSFLCLPVIRQIIIFNS